MNHISTDRLMELFQKFSKTEEVKRMKNSLDSLISPQVDENLIPFVQSQIPPDVFLKIYRRLYAIIRYNYCNSEKNQRSDTDLNKLKCGFQSSENENILSEICEKYGIKRNRGEHYTHIMHMSYYALMCDGNFEEQYEAEKEVNDRLVEVLMQNVKSKLDKINPIELNDEELDVIILMIIAIHQKTIGDTKLNNYSLFQDYQFIVLS